MTPHTRSALSLIASCFLIGCALLVFRHAQPSLLRQAQPLSPGPAANQLLQSDSQQYAWRSTNLLFTITDNLPEQRVAYEIHIDSGEQRVFDDLAQWINPSPPSDRASDVFLWRLAPNGDALLLLVTSHNDVIAQIVRLDGRPLGRWIVPWPAPRVHWLPDSSGWVQFIPDRDRWLARRYSLNATAVNETPVPSAAPPAGLINNDSILVVPEPEFNAARHLVLRQFQIPPKPNHARTHLIRLPPQAHYNDVHLSPDGSRLLWEFAAQERTGRLIFSSNFPFVQLATRSVISLRISRADGSDLRPIGSLPPTDWLRNLQWMPDSRHFTFIYNDRFHRVSSHP